MAKDCRTRRLELKVRVLHIVTEIGAP
ncbi:hypothetical protein CCACVL1_21870 [Corchorus capsularis]|uniref:Uncharacterized protein n=1 Tax=Corchorus capsularis TaxID=210143 RepID=A0A1R3H1R8_COCAP|nr:hypothetical protein CCACVL1_21870 [Corchorus capsularis]